MATIGKEPGGRKRILFVARDGKRRTVRLGKVSMGQAQTIKIKIESLVTSQFSGRIEDETARWLVSLGDTAYAKLVRVGLVPPRATVPPAPKSPAMNRLGAFLDHYIESRCDVKPSTRTVFARTRKHLVDFFQADRRLDDITEGDADAWRLHLVSQGLAPNTINRTCGIADSSSGRRSGDG